MMQHLIVPLDGSELAERALPYAVQIAGEAGHITLLTVIDVPDMQMYALYEVPFTIQPDDYNDFIANAERSARDYLTRIAGQLTEAHPKLHVAFEFFVGEPAAVILDRAKTQHADAIVISTHGRSGLSRWLFGSVTQKVLNAMPCPVLVVPGGKQEKTATQEKSAVTA